MCMFCAAVPMAGALGAKLNADQKRKTAEGEAKPEKPIAAITGGVIVLLVAGSVVYHTTMYAQS
ncbi:MAG: hypothetical protein NT121_24325 [Chloroflexi bacterium]|nr:hypothetical protein [Chloroflexota bacterium]